MVSDGAMGIVGLPLESNEDDTRQKWEQRRIRHLRRLSSVKRVPIASTTVPQATSPATSPSPSSPWGNQVNAPDFCDVVQQVMAESIVQSSRVRRDHAGKVLWRTASQSLKTRPRVNVPTLKSFGGRSFLQCDLEDKDAPDAQYYVVTDYISQPYSDDTFFFFTQSTGERIHLPTIFEATADDASDEFPSDECKSGTIPLREVKRVKLTRQMTRQMSVPITSIENRKRKRSLKREFGKGLVGKLMRRSLKRKIVADEKIKEQMREISDHRVYFTYWVSFVQLTIFILMVLIYPFAPIGAGKREVRKIVLISDNGVLQRQKVFKTVTESFWIGPSLETLILLGAKYAPCMRQDRQLAETLRKERRRENKTGCCIQQFNDGCIQRRRKECLVSFTTFKRGKVCGQDPKACVNPKSHPPNEWGKDIVDWPVCTQTLSRSKLKEEEFPHMHCEITGRPCCIGTQSQCVITSQENCKFRAGFYHPDKTLCSQVDCLASTCGLLPFEKDHPNQFYRLLFSLFLNAGIFHLMVNLIFNFTILRDIEKMSGWCRTALIYILSGVGGNLWCAVLAPYEPEVGPSGATFGIISCLFVEVIQGWQYIRNPIVALSKLFIIVLFMFAIGLLPYIDNFSNIFGFIHGFFLAFIFLPYVSFGKWDRRRKRCQIFVALIIVVSLTTVAFILFYVVQFQTKHDISYFNCLPFNDEFCNNFNHGQVLEKRLTIY